MSSGQFEQMICDAIETLVDRAVAKADYDKTIQATILEHTDATIGKYKVKYQDSTFYAYAANVGANYSKGSNVYILIHSNDMEKDKTIIGSVEKLGLDYIPIIEDEDAYDKIGENCIEKTDEGIGLCSYKRNPIEFTEETREDLIGDSLVLYDVSLAENHEEQKLDLIEIEAIEHYMKQSTSLICGATFRTNLSEEQKKSATGNYGIEFDLAFNNNGEKVIRTYHININDMEGDPYNFSIGSQQYEIFDIDGTNFIKIEKIKIFCAGFPVEKEGQDNDIFVTDVLIQAANRFSEEDLNGCFLSIVTPQGSIFKEGSRNTLNLEAILRVKGKVVGNSQDIKYYWFREDIGITRESPYFHPQGGLGWRCLNVLQTSIEEEVSVTEFSPMGAIYTVKDGDFKTKTEKYKCVAIYDNNAFSAEINLLDLSYQYELILESSDGTDFQWSGTPIITCKVKDNGVTVTDIEKYVYSWAEVNSKGQFSSIKALEGNKNKIKVDMSKVLSFVNYKCSVYEIEGEETILIGSAEIQLRNVPKEDEIEVDVELYSLVINGGNQVFKYSEAGVSPASKSLDNPLIIPELSFSLYDPTGKDITSQVDRNVWYIPVENTMLEISQTHTEAIIDNGYYVISNPEGRKLSYKIRENYNPSYTNNTIKVVVTENSSTYVENTTFLFVKEGDSGTNGTEYVLRIVPNTKDTSQEDPAIPQVTFYSEEETIKSKWNFTPVAPTQILKLQMYKSGDLIYDGNDFSVGETQEAFEEDSAEGTVVNNPTFELIWKNLIHKYGKDEEGNILQDSTNISIKEEEGKVHFLFNYSEDIKSLAPANIIQCQAVYNEGLYSATLPIITSWVADAAYSIKLKEGSGFTSVVYSTDGMFPQYNRNTPFEIEFKGLDNLENLSYNWSIKGKVNNIETLYLKKLSRESEINQAWFQPVDTCDAEVLTSAVYCEIFNGEELIAWIHIPIHFLLNRYGQAALNGWDGNSVEINEEGGYILSPQIGAGRKESDNSFTGVFMGEVKTPEKNDTDVGIFGYKAGTRSIFLDAQTGRAEFGTAKGRIVIDPDSENEKMELYSIDYYNEKNKGLLIDFTTPQIKYGNGNFIVDGNGNLTAKNGKFSGRISSSSGEIGGWLIGDNSLYHSEYKVGMAAYNNDEDEGFGILTKVIVANSEIEEGFEEIDKAVAFWAGGYYDEDEEGYRISSPKFFVSHDGYLKATEASIGAGNNPIFIGKSIDANSESAIYSFKKNSFSSETAYAENGFYLGETGLAIGTYAFGTEKYNAFEVTKEGVLTARQGFIGNNTEGWEIGKNFLRYSESYDTPKTSPTDTVEGIYLGTRGIGVGVGTSTISYFSVDEESENTGTENFQSGFKKVQYPAFWALGPQYSSTSQGTVGIFQGWIGTWYIDDYGIRSSTRNTLPYEKVIEGNEEIPKPLNCAVVSGGQTRLLNYTLPDRIGKSIRHWSDTDENGLPYVSYQRITAGKYLAKNLYENENIKQWTWELLDDGSMYARCAIVSTNRYNDYNGTKGLYFGPEGLRVGKNLKTDSEGNFTEGPIYTSPFYIKDIDFKSSSAFTLILSTGIDGEEDQVYNFIIKEDVEAGKLVIANESTGRIMTVSYPEL